MEADSHVRAEEALRLLASAVSATRLYPESSPLRSEAIQRFIDRSSEVGFGTVRVIVDPHEFRSGDAVLGKGQVHVASLAETLHAQQVGQLILVPGITPDEVMSFIACVNTDTKNVRQRGGLRSMLLESKVEHLAVIELTFRASDEEGLFGLDLTTAPLSEIGVETAAAAERWARSASVGEGTDDMDTAIGRLEQATRDIASSRVAEALMRLDEMTRMKVLGWALRADSSGKRMQGMLDVVAKMKPAALARLLTLVALQAGTDPGRVATAIDLPPEVMEQVALLLAPSPRTDAECGVPDYIDADRLARDAGTRDEDERADLQRQLSISGPTLASGKALVTAVALSRTRPDADTVKAISIALPAAARDGAFAPAREALRRLDELSSDPDLSAAVAAARGSLSDPATLHDLVRAPITDADAAIAGELLHAAGAAGAEALIDHYSRANEAARSLLRPVLRGLGDLILGVAARRVRSDDTVRANAVLRILPLLGDKRAVTTIAQALEHLDAEVRRTAIISLTIMPGQESAAILAKTVTHWDPETQRFAVKEIGRAKVAAAIPALGRMLEDINVFERNHELKKEIVKALESIGTPQVLPILKRVAQRRVILGRRNKELSALARRAVQNVSMNTDRTQGVDGRE